ncbi:MAG: DEAD/DEAH box helicase [Clostridium sp.]|nr:DEAD/DEAH box helicase [Clostridium sp.]
MELRPYQMEAMAAVRQEWQAGRRKTLLVLPTGCGKTIVFCKLAEDLVRQGQKVLILAHRGELLEQAAAKLQQSTGLACALEKAESSSLGSWCRVVVGSVQSLTRRERLAKFAPEHFGAVIVDEAHHILSDSYQRVLQHFGAACVLGVTATPDRADMRNLGQFFDSLAYEYTLPQAVREGYLAPIKAQTIPLQLDLRGVGLQGGDFKAADLGGALEPYLQRIAAEMQKRCQGRKTVVFLPLVSTSRRFCQLLQAQGFRAAEVNGDSPDRAQILQAFADGEYDVLCNSMLLTEGWDCPAVDCVVVLRPTKSRSLYCQMVGRGTRLSEGKEYLLLLDFLWHTERHELCRPAHLLCDTPEVARQMTEDMAANGEPVDIMEAEKTASDEVIAQREEALARQLAEMRRRKARLVDPLQFEMSIQAQDLVDWQPSFMWEMGPASEKQLAWLEKRGIRPEDVDCAGKAALLIERLQKRQQQGLTTPKQIRILERYGFRNVGMWPFEAASQMIARIAALGWRGVPPGVNPGRYQPEQCDNK